ncbi:MAG: ROK family protein [Candidatus Omnitrophica bacterium]|nr:ROK family protein [Candidatus Omnitrophota bacterium]MCM8791459.1 ROK family protein [Candidatus Omnitrophota bacterium]
MKTKRNKVFTYHGLSDKENRNLMIFDLIRKRGVISRTEVSKITGINVVSVSNYINSYLTKKLILEKGLAVSSGGRKPELVELNTRDNFVIGVDASGAEARVILADIGMRVVEKRMAEKGRAKDFSGVIIDLIKDVMSAAAVDISKVKMVGVGVSDASQLFLGTALEKEFHVECFNGGLASCAAYAEKRLNPNISASSLLYMHTDLGRGVMISGEVCFGGTDGDGELDGAAPKIAKGDIPDMMRYMRAWDEYLSIVQTAKREVSKGIGTKIVSLAKGNIDKITEDVVIEAARQNDEVALNIVQSVGINLGLRIAFLINLFTPEVVVVGGGPEKAQDIIFAPMRKMVERLSFAKLAHNVKVVAGSLGEDAAVLGAAALAVRELFLRS